MQRFSFVCGAALAVVFSTSAVWAQKMTLNCTVESYAHSGFKNKGIIESWFPKETTHELSDGRAVWKEANASGKYTEKNGRVKITYSLRDTKGGGAVVVYTFIHKTGVFTAKMGERAGYRDTSGTIGRCKAR